MSEKILFEEVPYYSVICETVDANPPGVYAILDWDAGKSIKIFERYVPEILERLTEEFEAGNLLRHAVLTGKAITFRAKWVKV